MFLTRLENALPRMKYMKKIKTFIRQSLYELRGFFNYYFVSRGLFDLDKKCNKLNLCSGPIRIQGYCNADIYLEADIYVDLEKRLLPFKSNALDVVVCISAINYFTRERGQKIIEDVHRVLKNGGIARFATQDFFEISKKYVNMDKDFFFQKLPNGKERFHGKTMADKINSWFYGYKIDGGKHCKYFYDFETLALLFKEAGFSKIEKKNYMESLIPEISQIDNRPDQMFFLEAIK